MTWDYPECVQPYDLIAMPVLLDFTSICNFKRRAKLTN